MEYFVYLLECCDGSVYTGITNDLEKRMLAHKNGTGSKYVKAKGFKKLLASRKFKDKSTALKEEYKIKQLKKEEKIKCF